MTDHSIDITIKATDLASETMKQVAQATGAVGDAAEKTGGQAGVLGGLFSGIGTEAVEAAKGFALAQLGIQSVEEGLRTLLELMQEPFALADHAAKTGEEIEVMSLKIGASVEATSALEAALTAAGGSPDNLTNAMFKLQVNMEGTASQQAKVQKGLEALGISFAYFQTLTPDKQILAISDAFRALPENTNKSIIAFDLFSRAGRDLLPQLLKPLSDLDEKSKALGLTWSEADAKGAQLFEQSSRLLTETFERMEDRLGTALIPALTTLVDAFINNQAAVKAFLAAVELAADGIGLAVSMQLQAARTIIKNFSADLTLASVAMAALGHTDVAKVLSDVANGLAGVQSKSSAATAEMDKLAQKGLEEAAAAGAMGAAHAKALLELEALDQKVKTDATELGKLTAEQRAHIIALKDDSDSAKVLAAAYGVNVAVINQVVAAYKEHEKVVKAAEAPILGLEKSMETLAGRIVESEIAGDAWTATLQKNGPAAQKAIEDADRLRVPFEKIPAILQAVAKEFANQKLADEIAKFYYKVIGGADATTKILGDAFKELGGVTGKEFQAIGDSYSALQDRMVGLGQVGTEARITQIDLQEKHELEKFDASNSALDATYAYQRGLITAFYDWQRGMVTLSEAQFVAALAARAVQTQAELTKQAAQSKLIYDRMTAAAAGTWTAPEIKAARDRWLQDNAAAQGEVLVTWQQAASQIDATLSTIGGSIGGAWGTVLSSIAKEGAALDSLVGAWDTVSAAATAATVAELGAVTFGIAAAVYAIYQAFSTPEYQNVQTQVGQQWGLWITDALAKQIQTSEDLVSAQVKNLGDTGNRIFAEALNLDALITAMGGVAALTAQQFSQVQGSVNELFTMVQAGGAVGGAAAAELTKLITQFGQAAVTAGGFWDTAFQSLIAQAEKAGVDLAGINTLLAGQVTNVATGVSAALKVSGDASTKLAADQAALTTASGAQIATLTADIVTQQAIIAGAAITTQEEAAGAAGALEAVVAADLKAGMSMADIMKAVGPGIATLATELTTAGLQGGATFDLLKAQATLFAGTVSGPILTAVHGWGASIVGLQNANLLTEDTFKGLGSSIDQAFTTLVAQGNDATSVMIAMQPELQDLWYESTKYGLKLDENTKKLVDQAAANGLVGVAQESATQQEIDGINQVVTELKDLVALFTTGVPTAAAIAAEGVKRAFDGVSVDVPVKYTYEGAPPGLPPGGGGATPGPPVGDAPLTTIAEAGLVYLRPGDIYGMPSVTSPEAMAAIAPARGSAAGAVPPWALAGGGDTYITVNFGDLSFIDATGAHNAATVLANAVIDEIQYNRGGGLKTRARTALGLGNG
jgi:hypothetical protein